MKVAFACLLSAFMFSGLAQGAELKVKSGDYIDGYYYPGMDGARQARFKIVARGPQIRFIDKKRDIVYALDLNKQGEQELPVKFIEALKANPKNGPLGKIIRRMTLSNPRNGAKADEITVDLNIYIGYRSKFGAVDAKVVAEALITSEILEIQTFIDNQQTSVSSNEIRVMVGTDARLEDIQTNLGSQVNSILGLALDLIVRSVSFSPTIKLYQTK